MKKKPSRNKKVQSCCSIETIIDPEIEKIIKRVSKKIPLKMVDFLCELAQKNDPTCPHQAWLVGADHHDDYNWKLNYTHVRCRICNNIYSFSTEEQYWKFVESHGLEHVSNYYK